MAKKQQKKRQEYRISSLILGLVDNAVAKINSTSGIQRKWSRQKFIEKALESADVNYLVKWGLVARPKAEAGEITAWLPSGNGKYGLGLLQRWASRCNSKEGLILEHFLAHYLFRNRHQCGLSVAEAAQTGFAPPLDGGGEKKVIGRFEHHLSGLQVVLEYLSVPGTAHFQIEHRWYGETEAEPRLILGDEFEHAATSWRCEASHFQDGQHALAVLAVNGPKRKRHRVPVGSFSFEYPPSPPASDTAFGQHGAGPQA